jgi:hypothetical protein
MKLTPEEHQQLLERIACSLERIEGLLASGGNGVRNRISPSIQDHPAQTNDAPDSPSEENGRDVNQVEEFLISKGIKIKVMKPEDVADGVIDSLSIFLGERYSALRSILIKIKRSMQTGPPITEQLSKRTQEDISSVCQFCSRLHSIAFLEQYKYFRSPQYTIRAKTTTLPKAQMFFGGQWLERFTLQKLRQAHSMVQAETGEQVDFQYLINPQVILPNGDDFELDIIAVIGGHPFWIEAKSGDYQQHVQKYSRLARQLGLDYAHSMMVLTDVVDEQCDALSSLFSMTVTNLNTFECKVLTTLRKEMQTQAEQDAPSNR